MISGSANLDLLIDNMTIFLTPVHTTFSGESGEDGITGVFQGTSSDFTFFFADHIDRFRESGVTELEIKLNDVDLTLDSRDSFGATELDLFSMTIDADPNLLLITNEEGGIEKVYPKDTFLFYTNSGDRQMQGNNCRSYWTRDGGTIDLYDSENNLLKTGRLSVKPCASHEAIRDNLFRDQTYRLVHISPDRPETNFDITFTTPKSQKNYNLGCYWSNSIGVGCTHPTPDGIDIVRVPPAP